MGTQIDFRGEFWLESQPEFRVPGHLTFHHKRGGMLHLNSPLEDRDGYVVKENHPRIMGAVLGRSCLLLDCFERGAQHAQAGPSTWERQPTLLVGAVLLVPRQHDSSPASEFVAAQARFHGLAEFDGRQVFSNDRNRDDPWTLSTTVEGLETRRVEATKAVLEFHQGTGSKRRDFKSETLVTYHFLRVTPRQPMPLEELIELFTRVRTFIALAMHQDCQFQTAIHLEPTSREKFPVDPEYPHLRPYEYHARWRRGFRHSSEFYNRVVTFDSIGPEGIARWLDLEEECGHVISRLSSIRFTKRLSYEDALLRVVAAADSFHRVLTGKRWTNLDKVFTDLAKYAGFSFNVAVPDLDAWVAAVVADRHNAAHNKGEPLSHPSSVGPLFESVYWLVFICLLRRADAPQSAFQSVRDSQPFVWPMGEIYRILGGPPQVGRLPR